MKPSLELSEEGRTELVWRNRKKQIVRKAEIQIHKDEEFEYDEKGRLLRSATVNELGDLERHYTCHEDGLLTRVTQVHKNRSGKTHIFDEHYKYDELGRLVLRTWGCQDEDPTISHKYEYANIENGTVRVKTSCHANSDDIDRSTRHPTEFGYIEICQTGSGHECASVHYDHEGRKLKVGSHNPREYIREDGKLLQVRQGREIRDYKYEKGKLVAIVSNNPECPANTILPPVAAFNE